MNGDLMNWFHYDIKFRFDQTEGIYNAIYNDIEFSN